MSKNVKLDLLANDGRTVIKRNITKAGALRWLKSNIEITRGFAVEVFERSAVAIELNGGRHGWMFSVSKSF